MTWVASYNSSRFLILLGASYEDADDGVDDDSSVFLLLNTGNLCSGLCGSAGTIGPSASTVGTSTSSSRIKSMLIHLTASWSSFHSQDLSSSKITSLLIITFFVMGLYSLYPILLSPYLTKMHFSLLSSSLVLLASGIFAYATQPKTQRWVTLGLWPLHASCGVTACKLLVGQRFSRYTAHDTASAQYCLGSFFALSRLLAMSRIVRFFLSATPFSRGV